MAVQKTIKAKCWSLDHWIIFKLRLGVYENIMMFLDEYQLHFLAEQRLDFTTIPLSLRGKGSSYNLIEYLSINNEDYNLLKNFLIYFLNIIVNIDYYDSTG
jgi:hypothetical protein